MSRSTQQKRPEPIADKRYVFTFGKYRGFTLDDVMYSDPGYIVWMSKNTDLDFHYSIIEEIEEGRYADFDPAL